MSSRREATDVGNGYDQADLWGLDSAELSELSLDETLRLGESDRDRQEGNSRIAVRTIQAGFVTTLHKLRRRNRLSLSAVERLCTKHGLLIMRADRRFTRLEATMSSSEERALKGGNVDDLDGLELRGVLHPTNARQNRLNISAYTWVHGALMELSHELGIFTSNAALFVCLLSLSTLTDSNNYQQTVIADVERLWRYIERRT